LQGIYPPISILPSLSRLMKDGIGADHFNLANRLFASYAKVGEIRSLSRVIGEDDLSESDLKFLEYGQAFEKRFINQRNYDNRTITETLNLAEELLDILV